jgi:hypothetical protein
MSMAEDRLLLRLSRWILVEVRPGVVCMRLDLDAPVEQEWNDMFAAARAFQGRLQHVSLRLGYSSTKISQFSVVFMRPTLTSRHTMAMLIAPSVSCSSFSFKILLHLLLLAIASM